MALDNKLGCSDRLPQVVLVGRPNVGKTALFNALTYSRKAIVDAQPHLTRDRQEALITCDGVRLKLVDCGGWIERASEVITREITKQTSKAIEEADLLVMVVDALVGWQPEEKRLVKHLKRTKSPILLVINKAENWSSERFYEFAALGLKDFCAVSALQRAGLQELRLRIAKLLPSDVSSVGRSAESEVKAPEVATTASITPSTLPASTSSASVAADEVDAPSERSLVFFGCPNVGKSTLINRILGTSRLITADMPGTTRDSVRVPFERRGVAYTLIDTAGVRPASKLASRVEAVSVIKAFSALKLANLVVLVLDAKLGPRDQDLRLINKTLREGKGLIIAANKFDLVPKEELAKLKELLAWKLASVSQLPLVPISAQTGFGLKTLWRAIETAFKAKEQKVSTNKLNQILQRATAHHAAPLVNGKEVKLRYVHLVNTNPLELVIHGVRVSHLPSSYQRYLISFFQQALNWQAFPVKLTFRSSH